MIVPNKVISLDESSLGHAAVILKHGPNPQDLLTLYKKTSDRFESIDQFLLTLDLLYVLGRIDVVPSARTITYVA